MNKKVVVASSLILLVSASANAQIYLGAKAGASWVDDLCTSGSQCDENSWALGSFLGYEFNDHFALEAGLDTLGKTTGAGYTDAGLISYSLAPRFNIPLTNSLDVFAKAGGAYVEYGNKSDSTLMGSLGLSYNVLPNIDIQLEYQRLADIDIESHGISGNAVTLGFTTKFGSSANTVNEPVVQEEMQLQNVAVEEVIVKPVMKTYETQVVYSVQFKFDSAELTDSSKVALQEVSEFMLQYPESSVDVIGHTDISGPASYNLTLSEQRAQSVADVINSFGVNNSRINVKGEGVSNPVASNETREGRIQNRRAEVVINEFEYQVN